MSYNSAQPWYIDRFGNYYHGDLQPGDREATPEETLTKDLQAAKESKTIALYYQCGDVIIAGFHSNALGGDYLYPSKSTDQQNLSALVTLSLYPSNPPDWQCQFWCMDSNGVWDMRVHTAAQIQQVGVDGSVSIMSDILHKAALEQQVEAATTIDDVETVTW